MESTKRAGWYKKGFNAETHLTPENASAARINGRLGGRPWSPAYRAVAELEIGKECLLKWRLDAQGAILPRQRWPLDIVRRVSQRTGRKFWSRGGASGLIITRRE